MYMGADVAITRKVAAGKYHFLIFISVAAKEL
jgi:hypothetical protein